MIQNKTVIEIIKQHLIDNEFDGLYNTELDCGCKIDDLEPCDALQSDCKAGYKHECDDGYDYYINDKKILSNTLD